MASWAEFSRDAPQMARVGLVLLRKLPGTQQRPEVAYLATVRRDGGPRVHPVCPVIAGEHLYVSIGGQSAKLRDLRGDGRYMIHALVSESDDEFSVRGRAFKANDAATRAHAAEALALSGINTSEREVLFRFEIDRADSRLLGERRQAGRTRGPPQVACRGVGRAR